MNPRHKMPRIAWLLVVILFAGAVLVELSRFTEGMNPGSMSSLPSGTKAFAELLRSKGYSVRYSRSMMELPAKDEIGIGFVTMQTSFGGSAWFEPDSVKFGERIVKQGGTLMIVPLRTTFRQDSVKSEQATTKIEDESGVNLQVTDSLVEDDMSDLLVLDATESRDLWEADDGRIFSQYSKTETGSVLEILCGLAATNRFVDKADNAEFLLRNIDLLGQGKSKVVFLHGFHGDRREPSITEALGPWASGGFNQFLFLFLTSIVVFGVRFGLASLPNRRQVGTRELVDAYADTLQRAKAASVALDLVIKHNELKLMHYLKLPQGAEAEALSKRLPREVNTALNAALNAMNMQAPIDVQVAAARELELRVNTFMGTESKTTTTGMRKRRKVT